MTAPFTASRYVIACWSFLIVVRDSSRRPPRWTRSARPMTISSRLQMGIRSRRGALVDDSYAVSAAPIRSPAAGTSMRTESRCSNRRRPSHQRQNSAALRLQRPALADDRQPPIAMGSEDIPTLTISTREFPPNGRSGKCNSAGGRRAGQGRAAVSALESTMPSSRAHAMTISGVPTATAATARNVRVTWAARTSIATIVAVVARIIATTRIGMLPSLG